MDGTVQGVDGHGQNSKSPGRLRQLPKSAKAAIPEDGMYLTHIKIRAVDDKKKVVKRNVMKTRRTQIILAVAALLPMIAVRAHAQFGIVRESSEQTSKNEIRQVISGGSMSERSHDDSMADAAVIQGQPLLHLLDGSTIQNVIVPEGFPVTNTEIRHVLLDSLIADCSLKSHWSLLPGQPFRIQTTAGQDAWVQLYAGVPVGDFRRWDGRHACFRTYERLNPRN